MRKQINQRRQSVLRATIATIFLLCAATLTFAQDTPKFKVGDRIKARGDEVPATVVKIEPGWYHVTFDERAGEYLVMMSDKIILLDANDKPVADKKTAPTKETEKTAAKNDGDTKTDGSGEFKVGDRVKVNHAGLQDDKFLQPCTITSGLKNNSYGIRCDPFMGLSYMDYGALPEWIHPWTNASAAPQLECSFDAPAGTISKTGAPSAQIFKRVIYERTAESVKAQYGAEVRFGLQFTTFQMGTPFRNVMTGKGLLKDAVPENAMFYPVKAQFKECREVPNGDYNRFRVTKENFGCYQDRFGDWVCGTDSPPEFLENQDVPKN